jgi:predicted nucleic acid-binding protein
MASSNKVYVYWDACVFNSYAGRYPERIEMLDQVWDEVQRVDSLRLITSAVSILEVAFASGHGAGQRMPELEERIDALWHDPKIELVEAHTQLMTAGRDLMRWAKDRDLSLSPNDALHLATARWVNEYVGRVRNVFTYDRRMLDFDGRLDNLEVRRPYVLQHWLIPSDSSQG